MKNESDGYVKRFMKSIWRKWIWACVVGAVIALPSLAQIMAGMYSFANPIAKPLVNSMKAAQGIKSFGFCSGVGGVAFGAVAKPLDGSKVTALRYDARQPDGKRLQATVFKDVTYTVTLPVYDWLAVPVAQFANGEQDALFTLFGQLIDEEDTARRMKEGQRIMNYHAAIQDTFLGLRLMQTDLLAFHPVASENLTAGDGVMKAPGEYPRNVERNRSDFNVLSDLYQGGDPHSYVITDDPEGVSMRLEKISKVMTLTFGGRPYWACWRLKEGFDEQDLIDYFDRPETIEKLMDRVKKRKAFLGDNLSEDDTNRIEFDEQTKLVNEYIDANYFEMLPDLSRRLSDKMEELEGGNPPVYHAARQTMYYAAFFRFVKTTQPDVYAAFLRQIRGVTPQPKIKTPTVLIPPSN